MVSIYIGLWIWGLYLTANLNLAVNLDVVV
jgi:hypothetical protein